MRILLLVVLLLTGCGSRGLSKGMESFANRDYAAAHAHFINCVNEIQLTVCMVNAGASAYNMGNHEEAVRWYTLAARHGDQDAISRLTVLGLPVPAADLVQQYKTYQPPQPARDPLYNPYSKPPPVTTRCRWDVLMQETVCETR